MKKIILLNTNMDWGGSERWLLGAGDFLKRNDWEVEFICSPHSKLSHDAKRFGHKASEISPSKFSFIRNMRRSELEQKMSGADAVLIGLPEDFRAGVLAAESGGVEKILYRKGSPAPVKNTSLNKKLFNKTTNVIASSKEVANCMLTHTEMWFPKEKIEVIYEGLDLARLRRSDDKFRAPKPGEIVLGHAGKLVEDKGHKDLLKIASLLKERGFDFHILVAGYGELEKELKAVQNNLGLQEKVTYLGYVKDMPKFYNSIDYFVYPSYSEGSPETLMEAMAYEKICFAYDASSMPEAINYTNGYLSPLGDVQDMVYKIANHSGGNLGQNARQTVQEKFNYQKNMQKLLDILE